MEENEKAFVIAAIRLRLEDEKRSGDKRRK